MIHGVWRKTDDGRWGVRIPKDDYWMGRSPEVLDEVLVHARNGDAKYVKVVDVEEDEYGWLCCVYDEHWVGAEGMYDWDYPHFDDWSGP